MRLSTRSACTDSCPRTRWSAKAAAATSTISPVCCLSATCIRYTSSRGPAAGEYASRSISPPSAPRLSTSHSAVAPESNSAGTGRVTLKNESRLAARRVRSTALRPSLIGATTRAAQSGATNRPVKGLTINSIAPRFVDQWNWLSPTKGANQIDHAGRHRLLRLFSRGSDMWSSNNIWV